MSTPEGSAPYAAQGQAPLVRSKAAANRPMVVVRPARVACSSAASTVSSTVCPRPARGERDDLGHHQIVAVDSR